MPVGNSSSRTGRLARISQSNIRPFGSNNSNTNTLSHNAGGHPLAGAEPASPTKKELKHRFEIVKKLGSGTYGKVSLAFDHKFEREVAVKLIKKSAIENKADLVRIRREIRIMSALNHPNIIQIFEVFENKDKIILVMEYASGGELYDYVSKFGSLPESEARRLFRQITSSVLYCHKHQVAHRDLKLENILLDQDNNAKIADFGLSNYFSDKVMLTTFCGSPLYASPEIINGTPYKGPEVDCWSLGILLYTLVYGSMPFDGRDFNRMVRQIKRGAYYEPDTPSTASMLIRNMLRVNPDRRADIFDIASHWWLNLEENMPVIQELPENQITDHTPLTERAETMIVQDLADETDVFMEFGHLSNETRKKIEEFRRRRKEAEEYMDQSPIKPNKKDANGKISGANEMKAEDKSLRGMKDKTEKKEDDPLERLRQIENRLGKTRKQASIDNEKPKEKEPPVAAKTTKVEKVMEAQPEDPSTARNATRAPSFVPVTEKPTVRQEPVPSSRRPSLTSYRIETDSINMLMNQVLEQMEKGPVSITMIARIKAHPLYDSRPMVKELLESIIEAQPQSVQKQTSKVMQTQEPPRKTTKLENKQKTMGERPWHSVEVGFDPDDHEEIMEESMISNATEVTVQDTSFEDSEDGKTNNEQTTQTEHIEETETDDDDEYTDSEMEDLAEEVEQVEPKKEAHKDKEKNKENLETGGAPPDPASMPVQYLDAFDRGLIKRQSKGKYQQHQHVDMYGRGVSTECEEPNLSRKIFGGPQPHPRHSPFLFNKAKKVLMDFPGAPGPLNLENELIERRKKEILNNNVEHREGSPIVSYVGSVPPRTPPPLNESESESEEDEESEEEESDDEMPIRQRTAIIGEVRRDGDKIVSTVELAGRRTSFMQSAPASIHASMSPEPRGATGANSRYLVTIAELKKPIEPKPYSRVHQSTVEKKILDREANLKEELREISAINSLKKEVSLGVLDNSEADPDDKGKESWESAAAYIRRKNRERRFRNRTIGAPEEITSLRTDRPSVGADATEVSNGYHHTYEYPTSNVGLSTYKPSRYEEDPIDRDRTMSPTYRYQPREKSYDYLDNHDSRLSAYTVGDTKSYYTSNASPSYTRKFEQDNNIQTWITEPRKFEVYKTRAERDREMNTMHTTPTAANSYRPSTYYSVGNDRTSTYQTRAENAYKTTTNNDNLYGYKRNTYDFDRSVTPGTTDYTSHLPSSVLDSPTGGRITARRVQSALTEGDKRSYIRSKSMERKAAMEQHDYGANIRNRLITPEVANDYTYVNYHDSSNGRNSQSRDSQAPKSILKNKQFDTDHRSSSTTNDASNGHVRSVFDRLRRHLSMEKSTSPQRQQNHTGSSQGNSDVLGAKADDSPRKKRSLLSFNRRKTSEVRLGSDGKLITNNGIDEYKRPSSPIDRIKSLFRKGDNNTNTTHTSDYYMPSRFSATTSVNSGTDKQYGRYPTTNVASTARDTYVPQYRKYPGSTSRDTNALLNRYSYTQGLTEQRRHWYDDPDLY